MAADIQDPQAQDAALKARHRAMWASGDYPSMVETFLLPLGPRLVEACGIGPGMRVLDVAAGTGNASIPAAQRGAERHRERPHARAARGRPRTAPTARASTLDWVEADAEHLPFDDASFDVVMSVDRRDVRAPPPGRGRRARPRLPPGRHDRPAELDARGHDRRRCSARWARSRRRPRPAPSRRRCGAARTTCASCSATASTFAHAGARRARHHRVRAPARLRRALQGALRPDDRGAQANAEQRRPRRPSSTRRSTRFCDEWNRGTEDRARFEMEYLLAVGTRVAG